MKRVLAIVLLLCLLLCGCGAGGPDAPVAPPPIEPAEVSPSLAQLRSEITESGALCAVAYLGYAELPDYADVAVYLEANGFGEVYPFLLDAMEDHAVLAEGGEVYAVIPAADDVVITVYQQLFDEAEMGLVKGEKLLTIDDGMPVVLRCNVSDIMPNLLVEAEQSDFGPIVYSPCLSLMDGLLEPGEGVYDASPYDLLMAQWPGYNPVDESAFCGTWYAQQYDASGNLVQMTLSLEPGGYAYYAYGAPYGDLYESFEGTWSECGDLRMQLTLCGGPVSSDGNEVQGQPYSLAAEFSWDFQGGALVLCHESGDPLLYGMEGDWHTFLSFDGFYLMDNWSALSEDGNEYYDLQLFDNGECVFSIGAINGERLAAYEGWWSVQEGVLELSMILGAGQDPLFPERDYLSGTYEAVCTQSGDLQLSWLSGEILTIDMEGTGTEKFFGS